MKRCRKDENYKRQEYGMPLNLLKTLFLEFQAPLETKPVPYRTDWRSSYVRFDAFAYFTYTACIDRSGGVCHYPRT